MNEADKNKLIITTSWLFEAVNNQYRAVINDIRKSMMFSMYKLSTLFNKFNKNINLSFSLINQAQRNFVVVLKQAQFNSVTLNNIYKMYASTTYTSNTFLEKQSLYIHCLFFYTSQCKCRLLVKI